MVSPDIFILASGAEIALIAAAAAATVSAAGSLSAASAQSKAARFNAKVADQNAAAARKQAEADAARQQRLIDRQLAKRRTAFGASGTTLEGSPLDLLEDVAAEGQLDVLGIRQQGLAQAREFNISASQSRARGRAARSQGFFQAGSTLLSGVSSFASGFDKLPKDAFLKGGGRKTGTNQKAGTTNWEVE